MNYKIPYRILPAALLIVILLVHTVHAQTITGKVVGVADGDTITVLQDRSQFKIRLYGIDTPEKGQDFGNRAKQFTSGMVFGKQAQVFQKDIDRYDRVVGTSVVPVSIRRLSGPGLHGFISDTANAASAGNGLIWKPKQGLLRQVCGHIRTRYRRGFTGGVPGLGLRKSSVANTMAIPVLMPSIKRDVNTSIAKNARWCLVTGRRQ